MKRVFKGAGKNLFIEADRDELALGIVILFVLRHTPPVGEGFDDSEMHFDGSSIAQNDFFYRFNQCISSHVRLGKHKFPFLIEPARIMLRDIVVSDPFVVVQSNSIIHPKHSSIDCGNGQLP